MTGRGEDVAQQHIDQINPTGTNFAPAIACAVTQAQTVLLNFQKLPIDRKNVGRPLRSRRSQFALRMGQDFFEVPRHQSSLRTAIFPATAVVYVVVAAAVTGGRIFCTGGLWPPKPMCRETAGGHRPPLQHYRASAPACLPAGWNALPAPQIL